MRDTTALVGDVLAKKMGWKPGDKVILTTPFQTCTYKIVASVDGHANLAISLSHDGAAVAVLQDREGKTIWKAP